jgi:hypothetical protein
MTKWTKNPGALLSGLLLGVLAAGGCASYTAPVVAETPLTGEARRFEALWRASQDVLREKYDFELDRLDRRAGVVTTRPLTGPQLAEGWRKDAVGLDARLESTVQTIYRVASVRIVADGTGRDDPQVTVDIWRSDRPAPQITSVSQAYGMFLLSGDEGIRDRRRMLLDVPVEEAEGRVPLGHDDRLAEQLRADILAAAEGYQASLP